MYGFWDTTKQIKINKRADKLARKGAGEATQNCTHDIPLYINFYNVFK